jgi:hypothetical protein
MAVIVRRGGGNGQQRTAEGGWEWEAVGHVGIIHIRSCPTMDSLIAYNEAAEFLKNPPTMLPRPDFAKLRALTKHMTQALKQLVCPQSQIHGWTGLVMAPGLYSLIEPYAFFIPPDPGPVPVYTPFTTPSAIKMVDYAFEQDKKLLFDISQHQQSMLPHARRLRSHPIQGLQHSDFNGMECADVDPRHPHADGNYLR